MRRDVDARLSGYGVTLEPLSRAHTRELQDAVSDGELWTMWVTPIPTPAQVAMYIEQALAGQASGHMIPWAVRESGSGRIVGTTRFHDMVPAIDRVEIGYTWYAQSWQRTHVNSACKLLLLGHAFEAMGCRVVGLRTDRLNHASQRAIEALGAQRDGVLRRHQMRPDGSARDTVMYSILDCEWPDVRRHLEARTSRLAAGFGSPGGSLPPIDCGELSKGS